MTTGALFSAADLSDHLHATVTPGAAASAERVVWGWLVDATSLTERPDPVPDDLFSWALELGGIVFDNPTALAVRQIDDARMEATEERRTAILRAVSEASDLGGHSAPQGCFPPAPCWPDPIRPFTGQVYYT